MKQFISFVRKEFYHIFRDLRTMLILLGMPVVQIILFGFAITTEVKNVKVVQTWSLCLRPVSITICGIPVKPEYN